MLLNLAKTLSETAHENQKYGTHDYFKYHIEGVVNSLKLHDFPEPYIIVAYLHDIVEDTECTLETIENLFGTTIASAVDCITKRSIETRDEYLKRCASNHISRIVKFHDASFNATNCFKNKNKEKYAYYLGSISKLIG